MVSKILIAIDRSEQTAKVVAAGVQVAKSTGAQVYLLHVLDELAPAYLPSEMAFGGSVPMIEPAVLEQAAAERRDGAEVWLRGVAEEVEKAWVACQPRLRVGNAAYEISNEAEERDVDLIVLGRRGHGGMAALLVGGVALKVAAIIPRSVYLVH